MKKQILSDLEETLGAILAEIELTPASEPKKLVKLDSILQRVQAVWDDVYTLPEREVR
jgi:hypothetical protein